MDGPGVILITFLIGLFGLLIYGAFEEAEEETSIQHHMDVAIWIERHEDIHEFVAHRVRDGVLSNDDYDSIARYVVDKHEQEYRDAIFNTVADIELGLPTPVVNDTIPDPLIQEN